MKLQKTYLVCLILLVTALLLQNLALGDANNSSQMEKEEYRQEWARMKELRKSLSPKFDTKKYNQDPKGYMKQVTAQQKNKDLGAHEKSVEKILNKWKNKNKEYHARLTAEACGLFASGHLGGDKGRKLARKYALSALADANDIPVFSELDLVGYVMTDTLPHFVPKGKDLAQSRREDVQARLHVWKRLIDAIDPTWDPNEKPQNPGTIALEMGLPSRIDPQYIEDSVKRAKYQKAMDANRAEKLEYNKQYKLRPKVRLYLGPMEKHVIHMYSIPPYNNAELTKYLNDYKIGEETKTRIIDKVKKNIEKAKKPK